MNMQETEKYSKFYFVNGQRYLILILLFSNFFSLISLGTFGTMYITIPFVVCVIYLLFSLFGFIVGQIELSIYRVLFFLISAIIFIFSTQVSSYGSNYNSLMLYLFYFACFMLVDVRHYQFKLINICKAFIAFSSIFAFYGVFQFISYNFLSGAPLSELIPSSIWVGDANVYTSIHGYTIFGKEVLRAHSIYAEPSLFSQYCSISIIFLFNIKNEYKSKALLIIITLINIAGLLVSLSGTGIVILAVGLFYLFIKSNNTHKIIWGFVIAIVLMFVIIFKDNSVIKYYLGRVLEINISSNNTSGYYRFVLPIKIAFDSAKNLFLGFGVGNDNIAYELYGAAESSIANGFGKMIVDNGIMGLFVMVTLFIFLKPRKNIINHKLIWSIFLITIVSNIVGTFLMPGFWCWALLCSMNNKKKRDKELTFESNSYCEGRGVISRL